MGVRGWGDGDMKFPSSYPPFSPKKPLKLDWDNFRKGLNIFLQENEIEPDELAQMDNLLLIGKGIPTKRWGTQLNFVGGTTGAVRGLKGFYKSDGTNELITITDEGYLRKKDGASFASINGASWASGARVRMAQLNNYLYLVSTARALTRYSSPTLVGFATIGIPTILGASNISGATGTTTKSYRISAISAVGETLASSSFTLSGQPLDLGGNSGGVIRLLYTGASNASIVVGFNIYGRDQGYERFIASIPVGGTTYFDDGSNIPSEFTFPPTADSTGGPVAKYIQRYQDRLIIAGITGEPAKVMISGRAPYNERFDLSFGGNFIQIEQDSGDDISGLGIFKDRIIVFKRKSIWQIILGGVQMGNFFITTPELQLITNSYGCIAPDSIVAVENDIFFLSEQGVNTLGYQANYAVDALRTNTISLKVKPFIDGLTTTQKQAAVASYFDKKYILAIPGYNKSIVLDTERGAWVGPWNKDASVFEVYTDTNNDNHLLFGNDDSPNITEYSSDFNVDDGVAIATTLRTKQEDFGSFEFFKLLKELFFLFRNINGDITVSMRVEQMDGTVTSIPLPFSVTSSDGDSGWGADLWGSALWGSTNAAIGTGTPGQIIKWVRQNRKIRTMQMEIKTIGKTDKYEFLAMKANAILLGRSNLKIIWTQ